ncbi:MAG: T9SS type A sorting domain-containing protein [bacterium]|nr:T9SS type A sorting domain-containing protein [bacterium]
MKYQFIVMIVGGIITSISVYGQDWTFIGRPPYEVLCVQGLDLETEVSLAGTWRIDSEPESGGIFSNDGLDTIWHFVGLSGHRVRALRCFHNIEGSVFAATSEGLYRSNDNGNTWDSVTTLGTILRFEQYDFAVSPLNSSEWALVANTGDGIGRLYISHDAGAMWPILWTDFSMDELCYSRYQSTTLYFARQIQLCRMQTTDTTVDVLYTMPAQSIRAMDIHPDSPWLFFLGRDSVYRYDEDSGNILRASLPTEATPGGSLVVTPSGEVVLGSAGGVYVTDPDFSNWACRNGAAPASNGAVVYYVSDNRWIGGFAGGLYGLRPSSSTDRRIITTSSLEFVVFPNPAREGLTIQTGLGIREICLYDILGRTVATQSLNGNPQAVRWSLQELPSGTYLLVGSNDRQQHVVTLRLIR